jgi:hypothetical protein
MFKMLDTDNSGHITIGGTKNWPVESWGYFDGLRNQCFNARVSIPR